MSIFIESTSKPRELIESNLYPARCISIIDLGTVNGKFGPTRKIRFTWELPTLKKVFKKEDGEQPLVIGQEYSMTFHKDSNLRAMIGSWRGAFTSDQEAHRFDVSSLLGKTCTLNITQKPKVSDPTTLYNVIASVNPPMKGIEVENQINDSFEFSWKDKFDQAKFDSIPAFVQATMVLTPEYANRLKPKENEFGDGLPF